MKVLSAEEIRAWDQYTIKNEPIASIDLMERASRTFCKTLLSEHPDCEEFVIVCGPGNNGGDGLAITRILRSKSKVVHCYLFTKNGGTSSDNKINLDLLDEVSIDNLDDLKENEIAETSIIIDALLGTGLQRPLEGELKEIIDVLNQSSALKIAVDIPTGLFSDHVMNPDSTAFYADEVYTFQAPKISLLIPEHQKWVKSFKVLDIGLSADFELKSQYNYLQNEDAKLKVREAHSHKGTFGKLLLIGGSKGMGGAIILASKAALRTGCGLLKVHIPSRLEHTIHISLPEATLSLDNNEDHVSKIPDTNEFTAIGIGPGLGTKKSTKNALQSLLASCSSPLVIDADALNIIAELNLLEDVPPQSILCPHPKEFDRLFGTCTNSLEYFKKQQELSIKHQIVIIRKGHHTSISAPDGQLYFNSTGNSGMAKGGSGDVLTGIISSLLAQSYSSLDAAIKGGYHHGKAADLAKEDLGEIKMLPSDVIEYLFQE